MSHPEFYEDLEPRLAPLSDEQVDLVASGAEADRRYRLECRGVRVAMCAAILTPVALAMLMFQAAGLNVQGRRIIVIAALLCSYPAVRLAIRAADHVLMLRYRASFVRSLQRHECGSGL